MKAYIVRRILQMIPVLFVVTFFIFSLVLLLPGDPAIAILGEEMAKDEKMYQQLRAELGLDRPIVIQYLDWLSRVMRGDLGISIRNRQPVVEAILQKAPATIQLGLSALLVAIVIGVPAGILSAMRPNSVADTTISFLGLIGMALPVFWFGIMMIYVFAVILGWLPPSGYVPPWENLGRNITLMIMPSICLGSYEAAIFMRQMRSSLLEVLEMEYIVTARSKGLKELAVVRRHALKNAFIPVTTLIGGQLGYLIAGSVIAETIFAIAGVGRLLIDSINTRDFPVVQGVILVLVVTVLVANLLTDMVYAYLDPRIRYE